MTVVHRYYCPPKTLTLFYWLLSVLTGLECRRPIWRKGESREKERERESPGKNTPLTLQGIWRLPAGIHSLLYYLPVPTLLSLYGQTNSIRWLTNVLRVVFRNSIRIHDYILSLSFITVTMSSSLSPSIISDFKIQRRPDNENVA